MLCEKRSQYHSRRSDGRTRLYRHLPCSAGGGALLARPRGPSSNAGKGTRGRGISAAARRRYELAYSAIWSSRDLVYTYRIFSYSNGEFSWP